MQHQIFIATLTFYIAFSIPLHGQADSLLQPVKKVITYEYFLDEGLTQPVIEQIRLYDTAGNLIEEKEFNKLGEIRKWEQMEYDTQGNLTMHTVLDSKGEQEERIHYVFSENRLVVKAYYDRKDRLYKRKEYAYEFHE